MASPAQINANRLNARKSTGPRSAEGKSASRFNALKHGIDAQAAVIPGENPDDLASLTESYLADLQPQNFAEDFHVETMIRALWQKRRLQRVEADLTRALLDQNPGESLAAALLTESPAARLLARTQRQIAAHERTWYRAHKELCNLRTLARRDENSSLDPYLHTEGSENTPVDLASFPPDDTLPAPPVPPYAKAVKDWPPTDPATGKPAYFVG